MTWRRWAWLLAFGLLLGLNLVLALAPTSWIESVWLAGAWRAWPAVTARLHALVPVGLTMPLLLVLTLAALAWGLRRPPRWRRAPLALLAWAALLALTFLPAWGAAYRRPTLAATLQLSGSGADRAALLDALERLVAAVEADVPALPLAELVPAGERSAPELDAAVRAAAACVQETVALVSGTTVSVPPRVRHLPEGSMLRSGFAGITLPWLLEPHVDAGLPTASFLAVAGHELVHAAGWAQEADTDALAVLAGLRCDHAWVRYASALHGVQVVSVSLRPLLTADGPDRVRAEAALAALPDAARADRAALTQAVGRWRTAVVSDLVTRVYDGYLRSQGVTEGVADYDAAGALLAAAMTACARQQRPGWCP